MTDGEVVATTKTKDNQCCYDNMKPQCDAPALCNGECCQTCSTA